MGNPEDLINNIFNNLKQEQNDNIPNTVIISEETSRLGLQQRIEHICNGYLNQPELTKEQIELLKTLLPYTSLS